MAELTLNPGGPAPDPLVAKSGESITITNNLGVDVTLTLSHAGLLNPSHGTSLDVPVAGWNGTVGSISGTFTYPVDEAALATRNGTISID